MDIPLIIQKRFNGSKFYIDGEDYSGLTWLSDSPKPTEQELQDLWSKVKVEIENDKIRYFRQVAYASNTDPLFFKYQAGETTKEEWLEAREKVARLYPYPTES